MLRREEQSLRFACSARFELGRDSKEHRQCVELQAQKLEKASKQVLLLCARETIHEVRTEQPVLLINFGRHNSENHVAVFLGVERDYIQTSSNILA